MGLWGAGKFFNDLQGSFGRPATFLLQFDYGCGTMASSWKLIFTVVLSHADEFFRDLQSDLQKRSSARSEKPKSLWEELAVSKTTPINK